MGLCALAFISCQKEEIAGNDFVEGTYTYEFVAYQQPEAKATIGDKAEGKWPVLWSVGDQMGVYKADGTFVGVATLKDECAGLNEGQFTVPSNVVLTAGDALYFSYPYVENAAISTGKIAAKQTLGASGVGANAVAYAEVEYNPGNTQFVLNHTNAYLKFNIKSEDFAGYNLNGVTLWATGAELSGDVTVADQLTVTNAGDYVKSTLATPVVVSADNAQAVWVTALPEDLAGKTVYAIVHMTGVEGTETATHTVTLPVKLNGAGELKAGSVTEINLPSLTKSLAPAWYEPIETRYIAAYGEGWSYGAENTVLFTGSDPVAKQVSLKARGNFRKVSEPKFVQLQYGCDRNHGNYIKIDGQSTYEEKKYVEFEVGDDYTIDVQPNGIHNNYGWLAGMVIKDVNKNVIWGMNLWASYSDITPVAYENGSILPYNIGAGPAANTSTDTWYMVGAYFQWGRPFAFVYSNGYRSGEAQIDTVQPDLETSASNPYVLYYYNSSDYNDWHYNKNSADFWGNPSAEGAGVKSIFDPCPKGYRVISPAIMNEVSGKISKAEDNSVQVSDGVVTYDSDRDIKRFVYKGVEWPFTGGFFASGNSTSRKDRVSYLMYWTNSVSGNNGYLWFFQLNADGTVRTIKDNNGKTGAFAVRCMVDTENR